MSILIVKIYCKKHKATEELMEMFENRNETQITNGTIEQARNAILKHGAKPSGEGLTAIDVPSFGRFNPSEISPVQGDWNLGVVLKEKVERGSTLQRSVTIRNGKATIDYSTAIAAQLPELTQLSTDNKIFTKSGTNLDLSKLNFIKNSISPTIDSETREQFSNLAEDLSFMLNLPESAITRNSSGQPTGIAWKENGHSFNLGIRDSQANTETPLNLRISGNGRYYAQSASMNLSDISAVAEAFFSNPEHFLEQHGADYSKELSKSKFIAEK